MEFLSNFCPSCRIGKIFGKFLAMNKSCSNCNYAFEREEGYFVGAMFIDALCLPVSAIPTILFFAIQEKIKLGAFVAIFQMIVLSPIVYRFSRLLWIQLGYKFDPPQK